jgi:integrase/recombinase XerD
MSNAPTLNNPLQFATRRLGEEQERAVRHFNDWLEANTQKTLRKPDETDGIDAVDAMDVEDWLDFMLTERGLADSTVRSKFYDLSGAFNKIGDRYDLLSPYDPTDAADLSLVNDGKGLDSRTEKQKASDDERGYNYVTPHEKELLVKHVPAPELRNQVLLRLLWQTGARAHEVRNLTVDAVDLDGDRPTVTLNDEKTDDNRTLAVNQDPLPFLLDRYLNRGGRDELLGLDDSEYLFVTNQSPKLARNTVNDIVKKAADNAGIQETLNEAKDGSRRRITAHAFRHGFATHAYNEGVDPRSLQVALGHEDISTTIDTYVHDDEERMRETFSQMWADSDRPSVTE